MVRNRNKLGIAALSFPKDYLSSGLRRYYVTAFGDTLARRLETGLDADIYLGIPKP